MLQDRFYCIPKQKSRAQMIKMMCINSFKKFTSIDREANCSRYFLA